MVGSLQASRTDTVKAAAKGWTNDSHKMEVTVEPRFQGVLGAEPGSQGARREP